MYNFQVTSVTAKCRYEPFCYLGPYYNIFVGQMSTCEYDRNSGSLWLQRCQHVVITILYTAVLCLSLSPSSYYCLFSQARNDPVVVKKPSVSVREVLKQMYLELTDVYADPYLLKYAVWFAFATGIYFQVNMFGTPRINAVTYYARGRIETEFWQWL